MSVASDIIVTLAIVFLGMFIVYIISQQLCPEGRFHNWKYIRHYLDLAYYRCAKCGGEKTCLASENEIIRSEYNKYHNNEL